MEFDRECGVDFECEFRVLQRQLVCVSEQFEFAVG